MTKIRMNPFYRVQESEKFPHSRFFRRTFWEKIVDTFFVIAGQSGWHEIFDDAKTRVAMSNKGVNYDKRSRKFHVGLVDYATLFLNPAFSLWLGWCIHTDNILSQILIFPALLFYYASSVVNAVLGGIFTVLAAPFVGIAHLISKLAGGDELKQQASKLQAYTMIENPMDETLGDFLERNQYDFSDIIIQLYSKQLRPRGELLGPSKNKEFLNGLFRSNNMYNKNEKAFSESLSLRILDKAAREKLDVPLKNLNQKDKLAIKALLELNAGGLYGQIEYCSMDDQIEEIIAIKTL